MDPYLGILAVLAWAPTLGLCALLLIFGIRMSRSCKLESLRWLGVYIFGSAVLSWSSPAVRLGAEISGMDRVPGGWTAATFFVFLSYCGAFLSNLAGLVLGILILSDILFLLSKSGVAIKGGLLNRLLRVRDGSMVWGSAIVILLFGKLALILIPYRY